MFSTHYDEDAKLWSGRAVVPLYNPKVSVGQVALDALFRHGSKVAQVLIIIIFISLFFQIFK